MSTSTNELLEQGIQEVTHLSQRIVGLSEQERAFKGTAGALEELNRHLKSVAEELGELNCEREKKKWKLVWVFFGALGGMQIASLAMLILLSIK